MVVLGRPRDPLLDEAAMGAAVRLIVEGGYPALTMDHIAERASVSKAALYRRWPNKLALVVDAIEHFAHTQLPMPDTGRLRDDVVEFLSSMLRNRTADVEAYEALSAALAGDPELAKRCRSTLVAKFSSSFRALVARAVERGELPEGTDIELVADIAPALVRYRRQTTGRHLDEAFINRVADQFFTPVKAAPTKRPVERP
jgi:AcrR family transcriptional regulator